MKFFRKLNVTKKVGSLRKKRKLDFSHIASTEFVILQIQKYGA